MAMSDPYKWGWQHYKAQHGKGVAVDVEVDYNVMHQQKHVYIHVEPLKYNLTVNASNKDKLSFEVAQLIVDKVLPKVSDALFAAIQGSGQFEPFAKNDSGMWLPSGHPLDVVVSKHLPVGTMLVVGKPGVAHITEEKKGPVKVEDVLSDYEALEETHLTKVSGDKWMITHPDPQYMVSLKGIKDAIDQDIQAAVDADMKIKVTKAFGMKFDNATLKTILGMDMGHTDSYTTIPGKPSKPSPTCVDIHGLDKALVMSVLWRAAKCSASSFGSKIISVEVARRLLKKEKVWGKCAGRWLKLNFKSDHWLEVKNYDAANGTNAANIIADLKTELEGGMEIPL